MTPKTYLATEDGAVTVDWVVLTAALVGLSLAVIGVLAEPFKETSTSLQTYLSRDDLICTDFCDRFATEEEEDGDGGLEDGDLVNGGLEDGGLENGGLEEEKDP